MLDNHVYNLVEQLAQENKSLWRIKHKYIADSNGQDDCLEFWKKMEKDKEEHIEELTSLLQKHLD